MYCEFCGREITKKCNCIRSNKISNVEIYSIFFFIMSAASYLFLRGIINHNRLFDVNYFYLGALTLSIVVSVLLLVSLLTPRNYLAVFFGCHQSCNRSFRIFGKHFIVCARCTGIMIGIYLSLLLSVNISIPLWSMVLAIPMIIDGTIQQKTSYVSNNIKRVITGIFFAPLLIYLFGLFYLLFTYGILYISNF